MSAVEICKSLDWRLLIAYYAIDKVVEFWLGRTDKTKAGSVPELIWIGIKAIFKKGENK